MSSKYLVLAALGLAACSSPTQIVLSIDTTAGVPCDIDKIRVKATGGSAAVFEQDLKDARLPIVLKLSDETSNGAFTLEVTGLRNNMEVLRASGPLLFGNSDAGEHIVLESTCTLDTPCMLSDLTGSTKAPPPVSRFQCGDIVRRYKPAMTLDTFIDACNVPGTNSGTVLTNGARGAAKLGLSDEVLANFAFRFYSQPIRQIWAHEDGYISFEVNNPDARNNLDPGSFDRDLLGTGVPPPPQSAMVFWDGLTLGPAGVCYSLEGNSPNQKLRVTWSGTCQTTTCTTDSLNFSIVLDERTQKISFTYGTMMAANANRALGATATVGIVNDAKGCPVSQCTLATGLCADGTTPCGYTQIFSKTVQSGGVVSYDFTPIVDPQ